MKPIQWFYRMPTKIIAFFLLLVMTALFIGCATAGAALIEEDFYTRSLLQIKESAFSPLANSAGWTVLRHVVDNQPQSALSYCEQNRIYAVVAEPDGAQLWSNYSGAPTSWHYTFDYRLGDALGADYTVDVYLSDQFDTQNVFTFSNSIIETGFALRYWVFVIAAVSLLLAVTCFILLMAGAGRRAGQDGIVATAGSKIPLDLLVLLLLIPANVAVQFGYNAAHWYHDAVVVAMAWLGAVAAVGVGTAFCMNLAVRVRLGGWWKNTVLYHLLVFLLRAARFVWRGALTLLANLPLIWKTALLLAGLSLLEFLGILFCDWDIDRLLLLWLLEKAVLIPAVLYLALVLRRLQRGSAALAQGDLSYQVDTGRMFGDFKRHGENLNNIGVGMTQAVNDRLKSERLKTELITNVSHDIKTPLTSIINYSDLIVREAADHPAVLEYADVLHRQSQRLRKLIDDLVEASKASTGNVDVLLEPCEVGVLLAQTAGEYQDRLHDNHLELILRQPQTPVRILADGRHLWRVFDNLMNNICKYAMPGTRVYLTVEESVNEAVISFKNTSNYPLDLSEEELKERFVRGDSARSTDGNGLGLSIAQSLTELQNGRLSLTVDGDLFKAVLHFERIG